MLQRIGDDDLGAQARPREVFAQTVEAGVRRIERHHIRARAASCSVLPPGAAHMSSTRRPRTSPSRRTGRRLRRPAPTRRPRQNREGTRPGPHRTSAGFPVGSFSAPGNRQVAVARRQSSGAPISCAASMARSVGSPTDLRTGPAIQPAAAAGMFGPDSVPTFGDAAQNGVHQARGARGLCAAGLGQRDGRVHHAMGVLAGDRSSAAPSRRIIRTAAQAGGRRSRR
jgi:hypothetical protein